MKTNEFNPEKFAEYLRTWTNKSEGTIRLYVRTIRRFFDIYDNINVENINKFVSDSFRKARSSYAKYPFQYYLKWIGKENWYKHIVKPKEKSPKKKGIYLPKEDIINIIENIENTKSRDIAKIQYATGARSREIILIKEENISHDYDPEFYEVLLYGKGDKERVTYIHKNYYKILKKYMNGEPGFLFLDSHFNLADEPEIETAVNTQRTYYYQHLRESATKTGYPDFATHDFRRNVCEIIVQTYGLKIANMILGHSNFATTMKYTDRENRQPIKEALKKHQEKI